MSICRARESSFQNTEASYTQRCNVNKTKSKQDARKMHGKDLQQFITGWRRLIRCLELQVIFRKRATNYRAVSSLQKMTHEHEASYESSPPCTVMPRENLKTQVFVPAPRFEINLMLFVCASARESARAREREKARARECASKRENVKENVSVCILTCLYVHNFIFV